MSIKVETITVEKNLDLLDSNVRRQAFDAVKATLADAEATAKNKAPWTDRTANARNSIYGGFVEMRGRTKIAGYLGIGVIYGQYLELKNGGKFRIIRPTLELAGGKLSSFVQRFIKL